MKKTIAALLCMVMVFALFVPAALAAKEEEKIENYMQMIDQIVMDAQAVTPQSGWTASLQ
jgi:hypothetical protein